MKKKLCSLALLSLQAVYPFKEVTTGITDTMGITFNPKISFVQELNNLGVLSKKISTVVCQNPENVPLFNNFPQLTDKISYLSFADLPTAVEPAPQLNAELNNSCAALYIKRDDLTGSCLPDEKKLYGGNKVRKLEFLLADAQAHDASAIITFGCAGSNHALATAVYSNKLGMNCYNCLKPQINSPVVQQNLLLATDAQAHLLYFPDNGTRTIGTFAQWLQCYQSSGSYPYIIPTGGSCPVGVLGFVNAAFELKEQIEANLVPMPHVIYVPCGSNGTVAGLTLGFQLAGLNIHIMAVATEPHDDLVAYQKELETLYAQTNLLLHEQAKSIPLLPFPKELVTVRYEFAGGDYGMPTLDGQAAQELFSLYADINLDPTYTAKAAAALIADARAGIITDKVVIYWNSYCGLDFSGTIAQVDYQKMPACFHPYFLN